MTTATMLPQHHRGRGGTIGASDARAPRSLLFFTAILLSLVASSPPTQAETVNVGLLSCMMDNAFSPLGDAQWEDVLHQCVDASIPQGANLTINIIHKNIGVDSYPRLIGVPPSRPPVLGTVFDAAQTFVEDNGTVAVFGACTLETTREAQTFLAHARIPQINFRTMASLVTPNRITSERYAPFLQFAIPTIVELSSALTTLIKDQGWRNFAVLASSSPSGGRAINAIENAIKTNNETGLIHPHNFGDSDEPLRFAEVRYPAAFCALNVSIEGYLAQIRELRMRVIVLVGETRQEIIAILHAAYRNDMMHDTYVWILPEDFSDLAWQSWGEVFEVLIPDTTERMAFLKALARVLIQLRVE